MIPGKYYFAVKKSYIFNSEAQAGSRMLLQLQKNYYKLKLL